MNHENFERELSSLLNKHGIDNEANTLDFLLANFMTKCLEAFIDNTKKPRNIEEIHESRD